MYRHRFHGSTIFNFQDIIENMIFSNGGKNLHFFSKCPKVPRGHHPVSQSRVYQDSKNAVKRCMDPKTRCSHKSSFYSRTTAIVTPSIMEKFQNKVKWVDTK